MPSGLRLRRAPCSGRSRCPSLQLDRLVTSVRIELGAPDLVHALVLGTTEAERRAYPDVEVAQAFQGLHHLLGVGLGSGPIQSLHQDSGGQISLERYIV